MGRKLQNFLMDVNEKINTWRGMSGFGMGRRFFKDNDSSLIY